MSGRHAEVGNGKLYMIYMLHRMLDFRLAEVTSLLNMVCDGDDSTYALWWDDPEIAAEGEEETMLSPFCYARLPSDEVARQLAGRSMLVKAVLELWGEGDTFEAMCRAVSHDPHGRKAGVLEAGSRSFKVHVDTFGRGVPHALKLDWIFRCTTLVDTVAPIDLQSPDEVLWLVAADTEYAPGSHLARDEPEQFNRWIYGRQIAVSGHNDVIQTYILPERRYLGPTSMDTEMAFIMANLAQVQGGHLVFDPFVGTGSCLIAAAHLGALTLGADIDIRVVRDGKVDKQGQPVNVWSNFVDYGLPAPLGLLRADAHRMPWRDGLEEVLDSIICDPPYGVRAGGRKSAVRDYKVTKPENHIPATDPYPLGECMRDLLDTAARLLVVAGRLVFFFPSAPELYSEDEVPHHPALRLVANCEQPLTPRYSRRLIVMEKVGRYDAQQAAEYHTAQGEPRFSAELVSELVYEPKQYNEQGQLVNQDRVYANKKRFRGKRV